MVGISTDQAETTALLLTEGTTANLADVVRVIGTFGEILTDCAADAELDRGVLLEGAARYLARAMTNGSECEEDDLIVAVAGNAPSPFQMRVFGACCEVFDGYVVWGANDRYELNLSEAA